MSRPELQDAIAQARETVVSAMTSRMQTRLAGDLPRQLDRMMELSTQSEHLPVAVRATADLLDRTLPKVTKHQEERHLHITLTAREFQTLQAIDCEAQTVEASGERDAAG